LVGIDQWRRVMKTKIGIRRSDSGLDAGRGQKQTQQQDPAGASKPRHHRSNIAPAGIIRKSTAAQASIHQQQRRARRRDQPSGLAVSG
jgi:hypothetical protein